MKYVISLCVLLFVFFLQSGDSHAQQPRELAAQVGSCDYNCPSTSQCNSAYSTGDPVGNGQDYKPGVYRCPGDSDEWCAYCAGTDAAGNPCARYQSCPTQQNTGQSCGYGSYTDSSRRQRVGNTNSLGYTYVRCNVGSVCDGQGARVDGHLLHYCVTGGNPNPTSTPRPPTRTPTPDWGSGGGSTPTRTPTPVSGGGGGGDCNGKGFACGPGVECCAGLYCGSGMCKESGGGGGGGDDGGSCGDGVCSSGESSCEEDCGGGDPPRNNRCGMRCSWGCGVATDGCTACIDGICRTPPGGGGGGSSNPTNTPTPTRTPTPTPTPTPRPNIQGRVFVDEDSDQEFDTGDELGLGGASISLSSEDGCGRDNVWGPVTTNSSGSYSFQNLCYGEFIVTIGNIPSGYKVTSPTTQTSELRFFRHSDTVDFAVEEAATIAGGIVIDTDGFDCSATGTDAYTDGGVATLFQGGVELDSQSIQSDGSFILSTIDEGDGFHIVLSSISTYIPTAYRINGGECTRLSGFDMGPFSIPPDTNTIEFFVTDALPWYQTQSGDVRKNIISNLLSSGHYASVGEPSSVFFSSEFNADFGVGNSSEGEQDRWTVNREYQANTRSVNKRGTVSYSYYDYRIQQLDETITTLCESNCTHSFVGREGVAETGVYRVNGDLSLDGFQQVSGSRVVILVDGDVTINTEIPFVSRDTLLFLLASGDITISPSVGTTTLSSPSFQLSGIFSAEGNIIIDGGECSGGVSDRRLNVYGTLIANSLSPFSDSGGGSIVNRRSLCSENVNYPSYTVRQRYDILTLLTDFYKVENEVWREITP